MKIVNCSQNFHIKGGSDSYFFSMGELLSEYGHQVIPFCGGSSNNIESEWSGYFPSSPEFDSKNPVSLCKYLYSRDSVKKLSLLIDHLSGIDVFHAHIYYGKITASVLPLLKRKGVPVVQTLHEYKLVCPVYTLERDGAVCEDCLDGAIFPVIRNRCKDGSLIASSIRAIETAVSRGLGEIDLVDRFISVSHFHRQKMIQGGISSNKVEVVHNFIDSESINPRYGGDYGLYFGRVEELKGIRTLLDAAKGCSHIIKIVGEGSALNDLIMHANNEGLVNVEFLGFKSGLALRELIQNCAYVVIPSEWYENCPMSVLEAKAHGKPVIGSRIGGIPELINQEVDGFLFEPKSSEELCLYMNALIENSVSIEFGKKARISVENNFSKADHYTKLMAVYSKLVP